MQARAVRAPEHPGNLILAEDARSTIEERFRILADAAPIMIWLSAPDKTCTYLNRCWLEFTGRPQEQELGDGWSRGVHADDVAQSLAAYEQAFDARAPFTIEYRLRRHDGEYRWVLDHGVPRYEPDGRFAGYIGTCIEIHSRVQLERIHAMHRDAMHAIASARDVNATYQAALATVCRHLQWPVGEVWEPAPDGERLQLAAAWHEKRPESAGLVNEHVEEPVARGEAFAGRVWALRRPLQQLDASATETHRSPDIESGAGLRAVFGFPIGGEGALNGVMVFASNVARALEPPLEEALFGLAAQIGAVAMQRAAERQLRESDERFRLVVESVRDYAIFMLDPTGHVISWNFGAEQIYGYRADEVVGRHFSCFHTPRDIAARKPERELEVARGQGRAQDEGWRMRKDGTGFWASFVITATRDAAGNLRGFSKVTRDMTERRRAEDDLRQYADRLRALSNRLVDAQESERRRIAAELHDCIGQSFTALNINLNILKAQLPAAAAAVGGSRIDDCLALVESTVESIREVIADLRPAVLDDYGLPAALRWLAERFESRTGIASRVIAEASISRLPPASEAALFRIAQEALTNVLKHSLARSVNIHLLSNPRAVSLSVVDDGKGFEQKHGPAGDHSGWGLMIMRERAEGLGGWFSLESATGHGTRIEVTIPR